MSLMLDFRVWLDHICMVSCGRIPHKPPGADTQPYFIRKLFYSIHLQAVCDHFGFAVCIYCILFFILHVNCHCIAHPCDDVTIKVI